MSQLDFFKYEIARELEALKLVLKANRWLSISICFSEVVEEKLENKPNSLEYSNLCTTALNNSLPLLSDNLLSTQIV